MRAKNKNLISEFVKINKKIVGFKEEHFKNLELFEGTLKKGKKME